MPEIAGVQSQDVESQVKHLAVYNQETYRNTPADNVIIDPRTEHEIYLPSFYAAVKSVRVVLQRFAFRGMSVSRVSVDGRQDVRVAAP